MFRSRYREGYDRQEYERRSLRMDEIVNAMPGFLGGKTYSAEDGEDITVLRFDSLASLDEWRNQPEHLETQRRAREDFYEYYWVHVTETVREYEFTDGQRRVLA